MWCIRRKARAIEIGKSSMTIKLIIQIRATHQSRTRDQDERKNSSY